MSYTSTAQISGEPDRPTVSYSPACVRNKTCAKEGRTSLFCSKEFGRIPKWFYRRTDKVLQEEAFIVRLKRLLRRGSLSKAGNDVENMTSAQRTFYEVFHRIFADAHDTHSVYNIFIQALLSRANDAAGKSTPCPMLTTPCLSFRLSLRTKHPACCAQQTGMHILLWKHCLLLSLYLRDEQILIDIRRHCRYP